ncbi:MAG: hypothetical protein C0483_06955 [Pirellula sp.]|nr:hypothetical protein [Pirellula sp.]
MSAPSELAGFARMFWLLIGPAILILLGISIAHRGAGWFLPHDIAYLTILALILLARWYEFRENPVTSTGEVATPDDLRKFLLGAVLLGLGLLCVLKLMGAFWK